jgi:hypothetical protein
MKKVLIGILMVFLAMSFIVQKEHILKELGAPLTDRMQPASAVIQEKPKAHRPQRVELMAYPAPGDPLPPYPAPSLPTRTPLPTFTPLPYPTPGPTMNPWGD